MFIRETSIKFWQCGPCSKAMVVTAFGAPALFLAALIMRLAPLANVLSQDTSMFLARSCISLAVTCIAMSGIAFLFASLGGELKRLRFDDS